MKISQSFISNSSSSSFIATVAVVIDEQKFDAFEKHVGHTYEKMSFEEFEKLKGRWGWPGRWHRRVGPAIATGHGRRARLRRRPTTARRRSQWGRALQPMGPRRPAPSWRCRPPGPASSAWRGGCGGCAASAGRALRPAAGQPRRAAGLSPPRPGPSPSPTSRSPARPAAAQARLRWAAGPAMAGEARPRVPARAERTRS